MVAERETMSDCDDDGHYPTTTKGTTFPQSTTVAAHVVGKIIS